MGQNIEIKAQARNFSAQSQAAAAMADQPVSVLHQVDTFFHAPHGRLKLREFGDGTGELIHYERPDRTGPAASAYVLHPTVAPDSLKDALTNALGVRAVVEKRRTVYRAGQTRIHLDEVAGLGRFIELEVVLRDEQSADDGMVVAERVMSMLGIDESELVSEAYVDLLAGDSSDMRRTSVGDSR
ncbi:class IV adenylate cyclase [Arhodomonas sp. AD133]|uniref:class IV adenylate cyclase n=1 Tax=Arhodomonas sp. AD133 TaxID=3415009 RepID=UPI003EB6F9D0